MLRFELPAQYQRDKDPNGGRFTSERQPSGEQKSHGWWKKRKGRILFQAIMQLPANGSNWITDEKTGESVDQLAKVRRQAAVYFNMPESLITVEMLSFMKQVAIAIQRNDSHSTLAFGTIMDQSYGRPKPMEEFEEIEKPAINIFLGPTKTDDTPAESAEPMQDAREDIPPIASDESEIKI
jgi:hypothetical protein